MQVSKFRGLDLVAIETGMRMMLSCPFALIFTVVQDRL